MSELLDEPDFEGQMVLNASARAHMRTAGVWMIISSVCGMLISGVMIYFILMVTALWGWGKRSYLGAWFWYLLYDSLHCSADQSHTK